MRPSSEYPVPQPKKLTGYLWASLAFVTCPCHQPILAVVLSGTAFGAFLSENLGAALLAGTLLFLAFLMAAVRSLRDRNDSPR